MAGWFFTFPNRLLGIEAFASIHTAMFPGLLRKSSNNVLYLQSILMQGRKGKLLLNLA